MNATMLALNLRVMVRRVATGATPYCWEVLREGTATPLHISPERFKGMEAAYKAGEAWLKDYIARLPAPRRSARPSEADLFDAPFASSRRQRNDIFREKTANSLPLDEPEEDGFEEEADEDDLLLTEGLAD